MRRLPLLLIVACGIPDHGPPPVLDGPLLSFDSVAARQANLSALPASFAGPERTACAADTTRGFLAEVLDHGLFDTQVQYQWAPIVPGPDAGHPTLGQPQFFLSGTIGPTDLSALDLEPTHPFSWDRTFDITADGDFFPLVQNRPTDVQDAIHTEIEQSLFPEAAFGWTPTPGDRTLVKGSWIFDCGHPEYEAEIHPPEFVAMARQDGSATVSVAFANPYRVTQLFGSPSLVTDFRHAGRFDDASVAPLIKRLTNEVEAAVLGQVQQLDIHVLLEATRFDPLTWFVCAPDPRPSPSAEINYSYRFVARTGVTVSVARRGTSGCLELHAQMDDSYTPAVPAMTDQPWTWAQIDLDAQAQAGMPVDVRQTVLDSLAQAGITGDIPALHDDRPPLVGRFAPLQPRANASRDDGAAIVSRADDQPFPFYGRTRVWWR